MANLGHNISQTPSVRLGTMIVLTPAMQQKLKLWKPSLQELSRTIEEELEKNPVLEVQDYFSEAPTAGDLMEGRESKVLGEAPIAEGLD